MARTTLLVAGLMMFVIGALHFLAPQMMMDAPGIKLSTANHLHVIRAAYGGAYIGIAIFFLLGFFRPAFAQASLLAIVILFAGFATGRIFSIFVDGTPVPLYFGVLAFEVICAALAFASLRRAS